MSELEKCCGLVIAAGLATGHADTHIELMEEVLAQCINAGPNVRAQAERIAELQAEVERTKASAICYVSHNIHWLGEKGALGWCLGCGKHRSLIRETQPPQEQSNEN